jgi:hypothetical protein
MVKATAEQNRLARAIAGLERMTDDMADRVEDLDRAVADYTATILHGQGTLPLPGMGGEVDEVDGGVDAVDRVGPKTLADAPVGVTELEARIEALESRRQKGLEKIDEMREEKQALADENTRIQLLMGEVYRLAKDASWDGVFRILEAEVAGVTAGGCGGGLTGSVGARVRVGSLTKSDRERGKEIMAATNLTKDTKEQTEARKGEDAALESGVPRGVEPAKAQLAALARVVQESIDLIDADDRERGWIAKVADAKTRLEGGLRRLAQGTEG